ncbi:MAG: HD-GYP domain-containing protein [Bacillota bacterium]
MLITNLGEIIYSFSKALDLSATGIAYHHQSVALIAMAIAEHFNLSSRDEELLFFSALVHDAGVTSKREMEELTVFNHPNLHKHAREGYKIFSPSRHMLDIANILLSHHDRWSGFNPSGLAGESIPLCSMIIHLADRVSVLVETGEGYILRHNQEICEIISRNSGKIFNPDVVDAFMSAATKEAFWLDLQPEFLSDLINDRRPARNMRVTPEELLEISACFAQIIDNKSPFMRCHSERVATVAEFLAESLGFSDYERTMIMVAGYLHDLGKIVVPNDILDKPDKLSVDEFAVIKNHTYYTYRLLKNIPGLELVATWASYHHEKLNGSGYPFRHGKAEISLGSKIMAVADIFTALTEDRPYRQRLDRVKCQQILQEMTVRGEVDPLVVNIAKRHYDELEALTREGKQDRD